MDLAVMLNPNAASGRADRLADDLSKALSARGHRAVFLRSAAGQAPREALAKADLSAVGGLLVAGGDGSLHEAVNGLQMRPETERPPLGVLPLGTGNAFARDLGLEPWEWERALDIICAGHVRAVDLARVRSAAGEFYFLNILGLGFVVQAGQTAQQLKWLGKAAYTLGTLAALVRLRRQAWRLEVDGEPLEEDGLFITLSNSRYTGTHFKISPDAQLDDGLLDLTFLRPLSRARLLKLFPTIYDGRHVEFDEVMTLQARQVRIQAPEGLTAMVDGEFAGLTPMDVQCLPGALSLFMPEDE